jgi:hypothetical protein
MFRNCPNKWARLGVLLAALVALIALTARRVEAAPAVAPLQSSDAVRDWNLHAVNALINAPGAPIPGAGQTPPVSELHLAMVQGAVYDAVNAIDGGHRPYLAGLPPASPSASQEAAVATAAHRVLVGVGIGLVPALPQVVRDRLDALYADTPAGIPDGVVKTDGTAAGVPPRRQCSQRERPTADTYRSPSRSATLPASGVRPHRGSSMTRSHGWPGSSRSYSKDHRSFGRRGRTRSPATRTRRNTTR